MDGFRHVQGLYIILYWGIWGHHFLINNIQGNKRNTALTNAVLNDIQDVEGGNDLPNFYMTYKII